MIKSKDVDIVLMKDLFDVDLAPDSTPYHISDEVMSLLKQVETGNVYLVYDKGYRNLVFNDENLPIDARVDAYHAEIKVTKVLGKVEDDVILELSSDAYIVIYSGYYVQLDTRDVQGSHVLEQSDIAQKIEVVTDMLIRANLSDKYPQIADWEDLYKDLFDDLTSDLCKLVFSQSGKNAIKQYALKVQKRIDEFDDNELEECDAPINKAGLQLFLKDYIKGLSRVEKVVSPDTQGYKVYLDNYNKLSEREVVYFESCLKILDEYGASNCLYYNSKDKSFKLLYIM